MEMQIKVLKDTQWPHMLLKAVRNNVLLIKAAAPGTLQNSHSLSAVVSVEQVGLSRFPLSAVLLQMMHTFSRLLRMRKRHVYYLLKCQMAAVKSLNPKAEVARAAQALQVNITAARGLQEVLRTNLGPKGTMKM